MKIKIVEEIKNLIPALQVEELKLLEESILKEGVRDPLVLWGDMLVDGHNRYAIAQKHNLEFKTINKEFEDINQVKLWVIENQLGRRNLTKTQLSVIALSYEKILSIEADKRMRLGKKVVVDPEALLPQGREYELDPNVKIRQGRNQTSAEQAGKQVGVSGNYVKKAKYIEKNAPDLIEELIKGNLNLNAVYKEVKHKTNKLKIVKDREDQPNIITDSDLHNSNCIDVLKSLPDESIDMVLTDPPYGIDFVSNYRINKYEEITNDGDSMIKVLDEVLGLLYAKTKPNASIYLFSSWKVIDIVMPLVKKYFRVKNMLVWNKNNWSMGDLNNYAEKYEVIIYADKGNHKLVADKRPVNVLDFNRTTNELHPTEKPVDLLEHLILQSTLEGEIICDPFMGSGSTILAAENLKRNYIGMEINEEYYKTALRRINVN